VSGVVGVDIIFFLFSFYLSIIKSFFITEKKNDCGKINIVYQK